MHDRLDGLGGGVLDIEASKTGDQFRLRRKALDTTLLPGYVGNQRDIAPVVCPRVEGKVRLTPNTEIIKATPHGQGLRCELSDGTTREIDHLMLGTGYEAHIDKLTFIDPALRQQVREKDGSPLQNGWFESSVPNLYFVGALAGYTFGPLCRFVVGAGTAAKQISRHIAMNS